VNSRETFTQIPYVNLCIVSGPAFGVKRFFGHLEILFLHHRDAGSDIAAVDADVNGRREKADCSLVNVGKGFCMHRAVIEPELLGCSPFLKPHYFENRIRRAPIRSALLELHNAHDRQKA
jgi:hypothetical protein